MNSEVWPPLVRPLLRKHGPRLVWLAGLDVHGWPATWIGEPVELKAIQVHLDGAGKW